MFLSFSLHSGVQTFKLIWGNVIIDHCTAGSFIKVVMVIVKCDEKVVLGFRMISINICSLQPGVRIYISQYPWPLQFWHKLRIGSLQSGGSYEILYDNHHHQNWSLFFYKSPCEVDVLVSLLSYTVNNFCFIGSPVKDWIFRTEIKS